MACERENFDKSEFPKLTGQFIYMGNTYELDHGIMYKWAGYSGSHGIYLFSEDERNKLDLTLIVQSWPTETGPPVAINRILPGWYQLVSQTSHAADDKISTQITLGYRCDFSETTDGPYQPDCGVEFEKDESGKGYYLRIFRQYEPVGPQTDWIECRGQFAISTKPR